MLDHVSNKHKWTGNTHFNRCCHRRISSSEAKKVCWLKPGTQAHLALEEVVLNTKLLKDLAKLTDFCHTGKLEVYHSMMLKCCSKREHYSHRGMVARTQVAALDNNANTGRSQALVQSGEHAGEARYKLCFPKANKRWVVKPISEPVQYSFGQVCFQKLSSVWSKGVQLLSQCLFSYRRILPQSQHQQRQMQFNNTVHDLIDK